MKVTTVSKKIGKNIRKIRERKEITQEQLALDAGLNRAYIGYIERGERNPSTDTVVKIAKALKVSPKELI
ncbi:MAG: helix-turn-helix transcriptional regulator [Candidatus Woesebacteria bacterium]|nr:MAG: helix-turn-helix transcriptional regulator [Candidatus Woesebacteria bacterium]